MLVTTEGYWAPETGAYTELDEALVWLAIGDSIVASHGGAGGGSGAGTVVHEGEPMVISAAAAPKKKTYVPKKKRPPASVAATGTDRSKMSTGGALALSAAAAVTVWALWRTSSR